MAKRKPKTTTTAEEVISTTVGVLPQGQPISVPYTTSAGPKAYSSWVYACAQIRAQAVASVPLRLYTKSSAEMKSLGRTPIYNQRAVSRTRKRYMRGDSSNRPHAVVMSKAMQFGEDFEEVTGSPASELLRKVNPWQGGFELMTLTCLNFTLCGMAYWFADRSGVGGVPSMLMDLAPKKMEIVPDKANFIQGFVYGRNESNPLALSPQEVVYFRRPNPANPWYGKSMVEAAWAVINQNAAIHQMDTAFFANYARPDYLVSINGAAKAEEAIDRFNTMVRAQVGGKSKVGRMLTATGDVKVQPLSFPPKDLSGRDEVVEEICAIFGVPVTMVKANDPNLASASQGYATFRENSVATDCRLIEDVLNQSYLPMWGLSEDAFFAFDDPIPENREQDSAILDLRVKSALISVNEARAIIGEDESDDPAADALLFNGTPLGASVGVQQPPQSTGTPTAPTEAPKPADAPASATATIAADSGAAVQDTALNGAQVSALVDLIVQAREGTIPVPSAQAIASAAFPLLGDDQLAAIFGPIAALPPLPKPEPPQPFGGGSPAKPPVDEPKAPVSQKAIQFDGVGGCKHTKAVAPPSTPEENARVAAFIADLDAVARQQAAAVVAVLETSGLRGQALIDAAVAEINRAEWLVKLQRAAMSNIAPSIEAGGAQAAGSLATQTGRSVEFTFVNPEVQRWVDETSMQIATGVNETTSMRVSDALGRGLEQGQSIQQLTQTVAERTGFDPARSEMIARTESARAMEQGQIEAWKQSGLVVGKRWLLAPDACEFCRALAREFATKGVGLNEPYAKLGSTITGVSGGTMKVDYAEISSPPGHVNCRCSQLPILEGEQ